MRRVALALSILIGLFAGSIITATSSQAIPGTAHEFGYDDPAQTHHAKLTDIGATLAPTSNAGADGHMLSFDDGTVISVTLKAIEPTYIAQPKGFAGSIVIPDAIATAHGLIADASIDVTSSEGQAILNEIADTGNATPVANAMLRSVRAGIAGGKAVPSAHVLYVAAISNVGALDDDATITREIGAATSYWVSQSNGAITSFIQDGPIQRYDSKIASASNGCGIGRPTAIWNEARRQFPGIDFSDLGNHLVVVVPASCDGTLGAGVGTIGAALNSGGRSIVSDGTLLTAVAAHEFGHNFGLQHANAERCTDSSCTHDEYSDLYSIMGLAVPGRAWALPALDTYSRSRLLVADTDENPRASASRSLVVKARGTASGIRGVKVVDSTTNTEYDIDYRSGSDDDAATYYADSAALGSYDYAPGIVISRVEKDGSLTVLTRKSGGTFQTSFAAGDQIDFGDVSVTVGSLSPTDGAELRSV